MKLLKSHLALASMITFAMSLHGQDLELPSPSPYFSAIIVSDLDTSLIWYQQMLGFEVADTTGLPARGIRQGNLRLDGAALELIEIAGALTPGQALEGKDARFITGLFKVGFAVSSFDDWIQYLKVKGATFRGDVVEDPVTGKRMAIVLDPDGNRVQLFEE